jgi:parafibromin
MSDVLELIRQAKKGGLPISYENESYTLLGKSFPEKTLSCFKRTTIAGATTQYYTLRDILFYLDNESMSLIDYRRKVVEARCTAITDQDKADLRNYVYGQISTCDQIDKSAVAAASSSSSSAAAAGTAGGEDARSKLPSSKAARPDETAEEKALRKKRKLLGAMADSGEIDVESLTADYNALTEARRDEMPAQTAKSVMQVKGKDGFKYVLDLFNVHVLRPADKEKKINPGDAKSMNSKANAIVLRDGQVVRRAPIIIVPKAITSLITKHNCADFLGGSFITSEERKSKSAGQEPVTSFMRKMPNRSVEVKYRIVDDPADFDSEDWKHVVAVFVTGQTWQFKGWNGGKWSQPQSLFSEVLGLHLTMADRPVDTAVQTWNIKVLKVHSSKRHLDAGAANEFWMHLDNFTKMYKPEIFAQSQSGGGGRR